VKRSEGERESVRGLETEEFFHDNMIINKYNAVFFIGTTSVEIPAGGEGLLVEGAEEGLFDMVGNCHIILDSIKTPKNNVE
jgi:hypothetical protein